MSGLSVVGNVNVDLIVRAATELPPPGEEWLVDAVDCRIGGAATNAAMTMSALGWTPRLVGCVGHDHFGRFILDGLSARGLERDVIVVPDRPTGVSVAFEAPDRDRSFLISLGSLGSVDLATIPRDVTTEPYFLSCGYFTMPALRGDPTIDLLGASRSSGGMTFFDPGWDPDGWSDGTKREIRSILPSVDVFLPNELEIGNLAGTTDAVEAARAVQDLSGGWVVVKRGAGGCVAIGPEGQELRAEAGRVGVLDTTGAGDAFNAALMVGLAEEQPFDEALRFAVKVASAVVSRPSTDRYPSREDLEPGGRNP